MGCDLPLRTCVVILAAHKMGTAISIHAFHAMGLYIPTRHAVAADGWSHLCAHTSSNTSVGVFYGHASDEGLSRARTLAAQTGWNIRFLLWTRDPAELVLSAYFYHLGIPLAADEPRLHHTGVGSVPWEVHQDCTARRVKPLLPPCAACAAVADDQRASALSWLQLLRNASFAEGLALAAWFQGSMSTHLPPSPFEFTTAVFTSEAALASPAAPDVLRVDVDQLKTSYTHTWARIFSFLGVDARHRPSCQQAVARFDVAAGGTSLHESALTRLPGPLGDINRSQAGQWLRSDTCLTAYLARLRALANSTF